MGSQTLELKWANHKSNLTSELQEQYLTDSLLDVTIVCGEFSLKAHKTVLSASSAFFHKLFVNNPCKHPILIMTDVDFGDLKTIMEFMYQGEICVSREKLTTFLKIAEQLKIKGLSSIQDMSVNQPEQFGIEVDPHYSSSTLEDDKNQPQFQEIVEIEDMCNSPRKQTDHMQSDANQKSSTVKLEHELPYSDGNNSMHWQSEHFEKASSSSNVLHDYNLSSPSVSHQLSNLSSSHQLEISLVSHQLPGSSVSRKSSNSSVLHQVGVPLSGESFTHAEAQRDSRALTQVQNENTGRDTVPLNLHHSENQPPIAVSSNTKSLEAVESLNDQSSSQTDKTGCSISKDKREPISIFRSTVCNREDNNVNAYKCKFCQRSFVRHVALERHLQLHSSLKKTACATCNCESSRKLNTPVHLGKSTKEKQIECNTFHKQFLEPSSIQNYESRNTGEKSFECKVCHKTFQWQFLLRNHERTHIGEKPFQCRVCHKRFAWKCSLRKHKRTHVGEKLFECRICYKRFTHLSDLKSHETTHNRKKPF